MKKQSCGNFFVENMAKRQLQFCAFIFVTILFHESNSSCLSILNGEQCAKIQRAGQNIATLIKEGDNVIQNIVFRSIQESQLIINASMKYLRSEALKVKTSQPGVTPIETSKLQETEKVIIATTIKHVREGNKRYWEIFKKACKLLLKDEKIASILLNYAANQRVKRTLPTMNSLNGMILSLEPELKSLVTAIVSDLIAVSKNSFDLFSNSLKILLQGKVQIDFDKTKSNLEQYLKDSVNVALESALHQFSMVLKETVQQMEIIDSLVDTLKQDNFRLSQALHPAKELISEVLSDILHDMNSNNLQQQFVSSLNLLKEAYIKIKTAVTS